MVWIAALVDIPPDQGHWRNYSLPVVVPIHSGVPCRFECKDPNHHLWADLPSPPPEPPSGSSEAEGICRPRPGVGHDRLRLEIEVERLERELAPEARLLVAAER